MQTFTITNDFHNTSAVVRVDDSGVLSDRQRRRVRKVLCGIDGCTCGGELSERGQQTAHVEMHGYDGRHGVPVIRLSPLEACYR